MSGYFAIRRRQLRRARAPARGPATIAACSILGNRKQRATGSFTSREPSSRYSLSGGCFGCSYSECVQNSSGVFNERNRDFSPIYRSSGNKYVGLFLNEPPKTC